LAHSLLSKNASSVEKKSIFEVKEPPSIERHFVSYPIRRVALTEWFGRKDSDFKQK
jgi:hypothetical protein